MKLFVGWLCWDLRMRDAMWRVDGLDHMLICKHKSEASNIKMLLFDIANLIWLQYIFLNIFLSWY